MAKSEKLSRMCKERMVDEIVSRIKTNPNFIITNYMGSTVSDLELLRKNLKKTSSDYFVVKNSMLKIVFEKLKLEEEVKTIEGGMALSISGGDILATCKTMVAFSKDHAKMKIKSAVLEGKRVPLDRIKELALISSKEALLSRVARGVKAPITGFVNTLGGVLRKFVYCVDAIKRSRL